MVSLSPHPCHNLLDAYERMAAHLPRPPPFPAWDPRLSPPRGPAFCASTGQGRKGRPECAMAVPVASVSRAGGSSPFSRPLSRPWPLKIHRPGPQWSRWGHKLPWWCPWEGGFPPSPGGSPVPHLVPQRWPRYFTPLMLLLLDVFLLCSVF